MIKKISNARRKILILRMNDHAMKEVAVEDVMDKEAEVEVIWEDKTTDAKDNDSPQNAMATRTALFMKDRNTSGWTAH